MYKTRIYIKNITVFIARVLTFAILGYGLSYLIRMIFNISTDESYTTSIYLWLLGGILYVLIMDLINYLKKKQS